MFLSLLNSDTAPSISCPGFSRVFSLTVGRINGVQNANATMLTAWYLVPSDCFNIMLEASWINSN